MGTITNNVRQIADSCGLPFPEEWRAIQSPIWRQENSGYCNYRKKLLIFSHDVDDTTVLHEVLHALCPDWSEGKVECTADLLAFESDRLKIPISEIVNDIEDKYLGERKE